MLNDKKTSNLHTIKMHTATIHSAHVYTNVDSRLAFAQRVFAVNDRCAGTILKGD